MNFIYKHLLLFITDVWREIVEKDCQVHGLNREDAMDVLDGMTTIGVSG